MPFITLLLSFVKLFILRASATGVHPESLTLKHIDRRRDIFPSKKMRIDDNEGVSASSKHLVFAYYVTGHGFGHATRIVEVVRHLIAAGHDVHVVIGAPDFVFTSEIQSPRLKIRKVLLDCGAVQADALTVDRLASLEKYVETAVIPRAEILETEVEWLHSIKADFVVSDVVPVACRAAADAGIRSVCVTNFR
ncbi:L-arabinokinase-like [Brassica rapa]|nr:L-arabinokinase-like [Brassica rapa]